MKWFKAKSSTEVSLPTTPQDYPSGTFVETEKGWFLIAKNNKRYYIATYRCLDSWSPQRVVKTTEAAVKNFKIAAKLRFRNGSLLINSADGKVYLIVDGERRHLTSPESYSLIGAVYGGGVPVSETEINMHKEGESL